MAGLKQLYDWPPTISLAAMLDAQHGSDLLATLDVVQGFNDTTMEPKLWSVDGRNKRCPPSEDGQAQQQPPYWCPTTPMIGQRRIDHGGTMFRYGSLHYTLVFVPESSPKRWESVEKPRTSVLG